MSSYAASELYVMNEILDQMCQMVDLQKHILSQLERVSDVEKKETIADKIAGRTSHIFIDATHLEDIEKYYFMLDKINRNTYAILNMARKQKDKLYQYSTKIRKHLHKEKEIHNENKFITVLDSHFNGSFNEINAIQFNPEQHREIYESVRRYHEINHNDIKPNYILQKTVKLIDDNFIEIPIVDSLHDIPCMFHWFNGDTKHEAGVYICLAPDFIIQVPFPNLISKNSKNFKHKSIACKYKTLEHCNEKQLQSSQIYKTEIRQCNFVHVGESFIKIGSDFRCPNLPSFGAHDTLQDDIMAVHLSDIKTILMNSCSDLLLIKLWQQYHKNLGEIIFTNLDKLVM
jgi:hypothetical protein